MSSVIGESVDLSDFDNIVEDVTPVSKPKPSFAGVGKSAPPSSSPSNKKSQYIQLI